MREIPIALQYAKGDNRLNTSETVINLYPEKIQGTTVANIILKNTPGYTELETLDTNNIVGIYTAPDKMYIVTETKLYSYDGVKLLELGNVSFSKPVTFAYNGIQLVITAGDSYYYDGSTVTKITDTAYYDSDTVTYQDGYFIFNRSGTGQFFITDPYTVTFNALNYATAESSPDNLLAVKSDAKKLYLFGNNTIEIWYNSGDVFPFSRIDGGIINIGLLDSNTIQLVNNVVTFVGNDNIVYFLDGFEAKRISTTVIEELIANSTNFVSASYNYEGHLFYQLTTDSETLVYDFTTGIWHKRETDNGKYAIRHIVFFEGSYYGVDDNNKIYEVSEDIYTENGSPIKREFTTAPLINDGDYFTINTLQVLLETGDIKNDEDNKIYLRFSDNGQDWSNINEKELGLIGVRDKRIKFNRLGRHREVMFRVYTYAPTKFRIMKTYAEFS